MHAHAQMGTTLAYDRLWRECEAEILSKSELVELSPQVRLCVCIATHRSVHVSVCPPARRSVGRSVRLSVRPSFVEPLSRCQGTCFSFLSLELAWPNSLAADAQTHGCFARLTNDVSVTY